MMKMPHDVVMLPKKKIAAVALAAAAVATVAAPAAPAHAMKMRHDCCVWTAPVK